MLFILLISCKSYYYLTADNVNLRENPSLNSKIIKTLKKCDKIIFINDSKIIVEVKDDKGIQSGPMFKIRTNDNIEGYVFSNFLSKNGEIEYDYNYNKFDILGTWSAYYDAPNYIYTFLQNGIMKEEIWSFNEPKNKIINGKYEYDGCCKIKLKLDDGTNAIIDVVKNNGKVTLRVNCFIFDVNLFKK